MNPSPGTSLVNVFSNSSQRGSHTKIQGGMGRWNVFGLLTTLFLGGFSDFHRISPHMTISFAITVHSKKWVRVSRVLFLNPIVGVVFGVREICARNSCCRTIKTDTITLPHTASPRLSSAIHCKTRSEIRDRTPSFKRKHEIQKRNPESNKKRNAGGRKHPRSSKEPLLKKGRN